MTQMTFQIPDEPAERIEPSGKWLSTISELSLTGFTSMATATASEVIHFLAANPTPQLVFAYHASEESQKRLQRLLALNQVGTASEAEQAELDELAQLEHFVVMLKARVAAEQ